jgi:hypothetical protein
MVVTGLLRQPFESFIDEALQASGYVIQRICVETRSPRAWRGRMIHIRSPSITSGRPRETERDTAPRFHCFAVASVARKSGIVVMTNGDSGTALLQKLLEDAITKAFLARAV